MKALALRYLFVYWKVFDGLADSISQHHHLTVAAPLGLGAWAAGGLLMRASDCSWT
jgi:hypothetical protein